MTTLNFKNPAEAIQYRSQWLVELKNRGYAQCHMTFSVLSIICGNSYQYDPVTWNEIVDPFFMYHCPTGTLLMGNILEKQNWIADWLLRAINIWMNHDTTFTLTGYLRCLRLNRGDLLEAAVYIMRQRGAEHRFHRFMEPLICLECHGYGVQVDSYEGRPLITGYQCPRCKGTGLK